jgi:hypothetical protein
MSRSPVKIDPLYKTLSIGMLAYAGFIYGMSDPKHFPEDQAKLTRSFEIVTAQRDEYARSGKISFPQVGGIEALRPVTECLLKTAFTQKPPIFTAANNLLSLEAPLEAKQVVACFNQHLAGIKEQQARQNNPALTARLQFYSLLIALTAPLIWGFGYRQARKKAASHLS